MPTPFGLFPPLSATTALSGLLAAGTQEGISAFTSDIMAQVSGFPSFPSHSGVPELPTWGAIPTPGSSIDNIITALQTANTAITNAVTKGSTIAYSALLPTANIANAAVTTVPSDDINLFLGGIKQFADGDPAGLINAVGLPIAANTALYTLLVFFEADVVANTIRSLLEVTG
ncbi:hypothetical protein [Mycobacterium simiae]|uniref:hypothetical protein n=1 Tax=Mycobacterium simiae TaxID=1784 RepID=UPI0021CD9102|nr:hypothetical protein [Mycobacterium simiae]